MERWYWRGCILTFREGSTWEVRDPFGEVIATRPTLEEARRFAEERSERMGEERTEGTIR